jgi:hypothetical protein
VKSAEVFTNYTKTEDFKSRLVIEALTSEHDISSDSEILKILKLVWARVFLPEAAAKS